MPTKNRTNRRRTKRQLNLWLVGRAVSDIANLLQHESFESIERCLRHNGISAEEIVSREQAKAERILARQERQGVEAGRP